jgi:hypothetical protein
MRIGRPVLTSAHNTVQTKLVFCRQNMNNNNNNNNNNNINGTHGIS